MNCPNCFFEIKDQTKKVCPFCYFDLPVKTEQPLSTVQTSTSIFIEPELKPAIEPSPAKPDPIKPAEPMYAVHTSPEVTMNMDQLITTYHTRGQRKSQTEAVLQKKKRLPVWAQLLIWGGGIAVLAVGGYFLSLYLATNLNGWTAFWNNIFSVWR